MATATCPKCHLQVSLPNTDDHSVWVRCPLCGAQYSLRMALEHVPPALEILGPAGDVAMAGQEATASAAMAVFGAMPGQSAVALGEMGAPADTLAHPEHGAVLEPLGAEHFLASEQGSNGEHAIELEPAAPADHSTGQPPALGQIAAEPHEMGEHFGDFDIEPGEHAEQHADGAASSDAAAAHGDAAAGTDLGEPIEFGEHEFGEPAEHAQHASDPDAAAAAFGAFHGEHAPGRIRSSRAKRPPTALPNSTSPTTKGTQTKPAIQNNMPWAESRQWCKPRRRRKNGARRRSP